MQKIDRQRIEQTLAKQKAMIQDDLTVALLGKELVISIKNKIHQMEGELLKMNNEKFENLKNENKLLKERLSTLINKIEDIMTNDNTGSDIFSLGVMISNLRKEWEGEL